VWIAFMTFAFVVSKGFPTDKLGRALWVGVQSTLLYFPVCFVLEEVTFRGALDGYVYRPRDTRGMATGIVLAAVWGLWHLPAVPADELSVRTVLAAALIHCIVGTILMVAWRIGGNLLVPAAAHAILDGVRNALQALG
jgi:membrane protease YdiL (CAAX protease family)